MTEYTEEMYTLQLQDEARRAFINVLIYRCAGNQSDKVDELNTLFQQKDFGAIDLFLDKLHGDMCKTFAVETNRVMSNRRWYNYHWVSREYKSAQKPLKSYWNAYLKWSTFKDWLMFAAGRDRDQMLRNVRSRHEGEPCI